MITNETNILEGSTLKGGKRDLTQFYDERPYYTNRQFKNQLTTEKRHQNFDYTTNADRLMKVIGSNNSHPTGVIKSVYGYPTFQLTATAL